MVAIHTLNAIEANIPTMARSDQQPRDDTRHSKLNRLKSHFEKGFIKPANMELNQLRKPSQLFKPSAKGHRRKSSLDEIVDLTRNLQLSSGRSDDPLEQQQQDIEAVPEMNIVPDFHSPSKSATYLDSVSAVSDTEYDLESPCKGGLSQGGFNTPKISITFDSSIPSSLAISEPGNVSRLTRLKMKTKSLFFEQDSLNIDAPKTPQRPKLNKAHSETRQGPIETPSGSPHDLGGLNHNDIVRKRSRTLGSLENDLYHKRNNSLVKTIGSMVMLKPRQNTAESIPSSENSDSASQFQANPPEVDDQDTPQSYLQKLIDEGFETELSSILSTKSSQFMNECFKLFLKEKFDFTEEPLDISLRRFLLTCELPKETQQIDRVLSSFSDRYYECNLQLWDNPDQVYFLTFSLVMLQTDHFNHNNKKKMTKEEFVKNTKIDDEELITNNRVLSKEVLECFYDNITHMKFLQKNKPVQPIYSLSKRLFSSASSTNLETLSSQPQQLNGATIYPNNTRSYSISSSTSQFFGSSQVDPYAMILTDQINTLKLSLNPIKDKNPFANKLRNAFPDSYFDGLRNHLSSSTGVYIRFRKECNWLTSKTEIRFKEDKETVEYDSRCLIKVIKIAELNKEEHVKNTKFFPIGATTHAVWKKWYGVLTTCGFFLFDNLDFLTVSEREKAMSGEYDEKEPIIIDILSDQILRSSSKLAINGLFACQADTEDPEISTFNIFSTNKKELFATNTFSEMSSWIIAINYIAALDSCYIDFTHYHDSEIFSIRNVPIEDKIIRLSKNATSSSKKIDDLIRLQQHLRILAPFQQKTKENIFSHYHNIEVRLDWLWYELERNQVYVDILERELKSREDSEITSVQSGDSESLLEDSFLNHDTQSDEPKIQLVAHSSTVTTPKR